MGRVHARHPIKPLTQITKRSGLTDCNHRLIIYEHSTHLNAIGGTNTRRMPEMPTSHCQNPTRLWCLGKSLQEAGDSSKMSRSSRRTLPLTRTISTALTHKWLDHPCLEVIIQVACIESLGPSTRFGAQRSLRDTCHRLLQPTAYADTWCMGAKLKLAYVAPRT